MNSRLKLLICLLLSISFYSCSKRIVGVSTEESFELDINELNDFDYLKAKAKFRFDNGKNDLKATANIRMRRDSIIWMSISAKLGIEGARTMITRDSLIVIDRLNKSYSVIGYNQLSDRYNFDIDFDLIQSILLGNLAVPIESDDQVVKETDHFLINQTRGEVQMENLIGASSMKVERVTWTDGPTNNSLSINYSNFQLLEEVIFPYSNQILLKYKDSDQSTLQSTTQININYNRAELSKKKEKFPFNIPQKYERN